jgi:sugar (pentulose or hexulose) kinase
VKSQLWRDVLTAVSGRPLVRRAVDDAASVGARVVVGEALGAPVDLDGLNPVVARDEPDPDLRDRYQTARQDSDSFARAILDLA